MFPGREIEGGGREGRKKEKRGARRRKRGGERMKEEKSDHLLVRDCTSWSGTN